MIQLDVYQLKSLLHTAAQTGAMEALKRAGVKTKDEISQRMAYRLYGESRIKKWKRDGLIKAVKIGDIGTNKKVTYSLSELTSLAAAEKINL